MCSSKLIIIRPVWVCVFAYLEPTTGAFAHLERFQDSVEYCDRLWKRAPKFLNTALEIGFAVAQIGRRRDA